MVATFILTRAFAISALFVGAFPLADAAPVPAPSLLDTVLRFSSYLKHEQPSAPGLFAQAAPLSKRSCRQQGCLKRLEAETFAEILENLTLLTPDTDVDAVTRQPDEKRGCRQAGCMRGLALDGFPSIDTFARALPEVARAPVAELEVPAEIPASDADSSSPARRSCRQQGCLRELEDVAEAITVARETSAPAEESAPDATKEARSCRQQGCLRDLDTSASSASLD
ncbi:uncharacterized protein TRAVEDRAFT_74474 [Trametes versicolor FP-101664 SS1]|uniref:uncharacterized protein n=1 Tax=Trametes versicolor (strain FP-101664) TaxID=717944 RepID=UPI0004624005|nr:uncharacterized protein TRAVEDRAFT_74474 [Trametes versicolor FP-101664 SS1]EIW54393.1 hypothetical protein TRAVEDRAFT_74474 [Trametes versicolor FP-101664 SS1]